MIRIVACLLVLIATVAAGPGAVEARTVDCKAVAAYFEQVDGAIIDRMGELMEQPGFREHVGAANRKTEEGGPGFSGLSVDEREALIAYLGLPGDALGSVDEDDVPDAVRDLHDSSAKYWVHMVDMMKAVSNDSPSAAIPYFDRLETAANDNYAAQQALIAACSDEVGAYAGQSDDINASLDVFGEHLLTVWQDADERELAGIGYGFLFFANEDDITEATPAS